MAPHKKNNRITKGGKKSDATPINRPELNEIGIAEADIGNRKIFFNRNRINIFERIIGFNVKNAGNEEDRNIKKNIPKLENRLLNSKSVAN